MSEVKSEVLKSRLAVSAYQKRNPEKINEKMKKYYYKLKSDPEKYASYQEKYRLKYQKQKALKQQLQII